MNEITFLISISSTLKYVLELERGNIQNNLAFESSLHKTNEELKCKEECLEYRRGCKILSE